MKNTDHCLLCENQKVDFTTGVYCNITGKKPKFLEKCSENSLQKTMQEKLFEANYKLKMIADKKSSTFFHLYTFLSLSAVVLIGTYIFTIYLWELGWMSSITLSISAIGLGLIPFAVAPLNK
jgi:membrane-bound ClpP family serine protease